MALNKDYTPMRLIAGDQDDLNVISACLQDSVAKVGDFAFLPEQRRFALVANRFVWELVGDAKRGPYARVRAGLHFDDVLRVQRRNIREEAKSAILSLLAIKHEAGPTEDDPQAIILEFSGGGSIRLEVEAVNAQLSDISEPWPTKSRPDHREALETS